MASEPKYVSKLVVVQFPPETRTVQDQEVRAITVRDTATGAKFNATVWANLKDVAIVDKDVLVLEGKASQTTKTGDDGETRTYNNLSVNGILNLGALTIARKAETTTSADAVAEDDIPF